MFDQITLFMIFMMLCFAGIAAMFYFILRGLDELTRELRGERTQLIGIMHSIEASVDLLVKAAQVSLKQQAANQRSGAAVGPVAGAAAGTAKAAAPTAPQYQEPEQAASSQARGLNINSAFAGPTPQSSADINPEADTKFLQLGKRG